MTITLDKDQLAAVDILSFSKFSLFTGGPGTGKTTTLSHFLSDFTDTSRVWCFAPTGRAAQRMEEAFEECGLRLRASTIHAGLIPERTGYDGGGWSFHYNEDNQLPADLVVVDESSMIDTALMASLLKAIHEDTVVILVGDPNQLPPVGRGRPFLDMIQSEMIPRANLIHPHRFAGRLAHVCRQVNLGQRFSMSEKLNLDHDAGEFGPENIRHIERGSSVGQLDVMLELIPRMKGYGFDPKRDVQVIVSRNSEGGVSRESVNLKLQELLNPDGQRVDGNPYRVGDKVMCLQNGSRETWQVDSPVDDGFKDGGSVYVSNGETGTVACVTKKAVYCRFSGSREAVQFTNAAMKSQVTLGYGITSHKSQGGGWPVVFYMIDETRLNDRSLVYTAISRAKKACFTIGRMGTMMKQISKQKVYSRKTFLQEMLRKDVS